MKSIYTCPYCGAKSFNPLKKAFTGGLHTKGKVCMECGQHYAYMAGTIVAAYVLCRIFDAFFGPLEKPIRNDVLS